ncbi:MAG TPA: diguanylate cyclase [Thermomicrobiales bacterium]|nr:diguanylate cyclase [Thermomicrobiales bacterium]
MSVGTPDAPVSGHHDPLTGLGDLPAFLTRLDQALRLVARASCPLALLLIDLGDADGGAAPADAAPVRLAVALWTAVARQGVGAGAFRLGPGQFAALLPGADLYAARQSADAILEHQAVAPLPVSIGIAATPPAGAPLGTLLQDACAAVQTAREQGGRRAVTGPGPNAERRGTGALLGRLAEHIIETGARLENASRLAYSDPVTGLPNQRALYRFLCDEIPRATRYRHPLSLLLIDGDNLKGYNERLGYAAGDQWIKTLGSILVRETRVTDLIVRWRTGDEFVVALPETGREAATSLAERIRATVADLAGHLPLPATVSIGVATFPDDADTAEELLARVEEANHRAKTAGKNRVAAACPAHGDELIVDG